MVQRKAYLDQYQLKVAYPTIILTVVSAIAYISASIATIAGYLDIGWTIGINAIAAYLLFTPMHEAGHLNISGNNKSLGWLNEIIGWLSGIPLIAPFYLFRAIHFRHHAYTNDPEKDPDHWLASKNIIALFFHSTTIFPAYLVKGLRLLFFEEKISKRMKKDIQIGFVGLFFMAILLVVLGIGIGWGLILKLWILPAVIAQAFLALTFDWLPHHPHEEKSRYKNTRIVDIPGLSILFLGQNYHLVHHLYPRVPFYHYKDVYFNMKDEFIKEEVEIISLESKD